MSGGSYFHLFVKESDDLFDEIGVIKEMAERLNDLGVFDASIETREVVILIQRLKGELDKKVSPLRNLWKAVEYEQDGDYSKEYLNRVIEDWKRKECSCSSPEAGQRDVIRCGCLCESCRLFIPDSRLIELKVK